MSIELLGPARYAEAAALLARAFRNDPVWGYVFPDPRRRPAQLAWMFAMGARLLAPLGASYIAQNGEGTVFWQPPRAQPTTRAWLGWLAGLPRGPFVFGVRSLYRATTVFADAQRREHAEVTEPHWILNTLGVEPTHQGRGVATALLTPVLDRAAAEGVPCYVLTHNAGNVPFYERFGFRLLVQRAVFPGGPVACSLRREPGAPTA